MRKLKGFTLIELLVVIAIIGLLANLAVMALQNGRAKSRDARRVNDIDEIRTALELFYSDNGRYPANAGTYLGDNNDKVLCSVTTGDGFEANTANCTSIYMENIPRAPTPPTPRVEYFYCGTHVGSLVCSPVATDSYKIVFSLEGAVGSLSAGSRTATPEGIY